MTEQRRWSQHDEGTDYYETTFEEDLQRLQIEMARQNRIADIRAKTRDTLHRAADLTGNTSDMRSVYLPERKCTLEVCAQRHELASLPPSAVIHEEARIIARNTADHITHDVRVIVMRDGDVKLQCTDYTYPPGGWANNGLHTTRKAPGGGIEFTPEDIEKGKLPEFADIVAMVDEAHVLAAVYA